MIKTLFLTLVFLLINNNYADAKYNITKYDPEKILKTLFDKYDANTDSSNHNLTKKIIDQFKLGLAFNEDTIFKTTILGIYDFEKDKKKKYFVLTQTTSSSIDCHACGALVGISVFYKEKENWVLEEKLDYVSVLGSWGEAPLPDLVKLGKNEYGLVFYPAFLNQGINSISLIVIGKNNNKFQEILSLSSFSEDNVGGCGNGFTECYSYESKATFTVGAGEKFAPIILKKLGTKLDKNRKPVKFQETEKFIFDKNIYKKQK
ncbi:MAG: hypothetical protein AABZ74_11890 [Cyanobacteriota bacterium]